MKKLLLTLVALPSLIIGIGAQNPYSGNDLPPNPDPNKCYVRCITPDEFRTETVEVEVEPAYEIWKVTEPKYETVYDSVMIKEACVRYVVEDAVYEIVDVDYVKKEGCETLSVNDARFTNGEKEVVVKPAVQRWEYTPYEGCQSDDPLDCQVLCYREYDEQVDRIKVKLLSDGPSVNRNPGDDETGTYQVRKVKTPAKVREISVPAEYGVIERLKKVSDPGVDKTTIPAVKVKVQKEVLVKKGGLAVWEEIECELLSYSVLPINYEYSSANLTYDARQIIDDRLLKLMNEKPNIKIEITSHTDCRGNADYNQSLSQRRARSVVNYLVSKGINKNRLQYTGYGETRLKNRCADGVDCSESEHAVNRRTEFRVLNF